jgi:hypothetical protein
MAGAVGILGAAFFDRARLAIESWRAVNRAIPILAKSST